MGNPIATKTSGYQCFAFPDVCKTQVGTNEVPIPYPNMGDLGKAKNTSGEGEVVKPVCVGGDPVILENSEIPESTGDEAGALGAVNPPNSTRGKITFTSASKSVFINKRGVVRMFDTTKQNDGNAVGRVLGGCPTVFVGD